LALWPAPSIACPRGAALDCGNKGVRPAMLHNRRSFVSVLASMAGVTAVGARASAQTPPRVAAAGQWDLGWFDAFKGQHKQMYDYGTWDLSEDNRPLRYVKNYLDTYRDVFG